MLMYCGHSVTSGGLLVAAAHKAAQHFIASSPKLSSKAHLLQNSDLDDSTGRDLPRWEALHVRVLYVSTHFCEEWAETNTEKPHSFSDLTLPGAISVSTGWTLSPAPSSVSLASLEADIEPTWVSYRTPFSPRSIRNVAAYIIYHLPITQPNGSFVDQWVTPGWEDLSRSEGAVWTNEVLHFVTDNHLPYWHNYVGADVVSYCRYDAIIEAGLEQRRRRKAGQDDRIFGENCGPLGPLEWVSSSVSISTEIQKLLPEQGTKWLFMRAISIKLDNNRLSEQVYVLDVKGDLVAITTQHIHCIPMTSKMADKKAKI
nr:hypothetical protein CFP56_07781 [Quercus suber]